MEKEDNEAARSQKTGKVPLYTRKYGGGGEGSLSLLPARWDF